MVNRWFVLLMAAALLALPAELKKIKEKNYLPPFRNILSSEGGFSSPRPVEKAPPLIQVSKKEDVIEYYGIARGAKGRVAVISINGEIFTVLEGEIILGRYRVVRVTDRDVLLYNFEEKRERLVPLKEE